MVSRRKILSRSRDDLTFDTSYVRQEEEDVWYQKERLFKEHIQEVLDKWTQIDDEIWAKVIVFERNRRVAKAYARAPVLTINGSEDGFDGMRIGLNGFDNPLRDKKTDELKRHIAQGVKIKMDDAGNILVRRYAKSGVFVRSTTNNPVEDTAIGAEIIKLPGMGLESEKIVKLFDMKKFQANVNRELSKGYPDRRRLESQCLSLLAFVKQEPELLDCPIWILIVNVVAMDMLRSKLPPVQKPIDIKNRPKIPIPDEDPYSIAENGSGSSGSTGAVGMSLSSREHSLMVSGPMPGAMPMKRSEKPPKLPPRDKLYSDEIPKVKSRPDYEQQEKGSKLKLFSRNRKSNKDDKKYEDPYYCGLRARVPNFVKSGKNKKESKDIPKRLPHPASMSSLHQQQYAQYGNPSAMSYKMWSKSYESGIDAEVHESPYSHLYGRLPIPRGYIPAPRSMYIGEWD